MPSITSVTPEQIKEFIEFLDEWDKVIKQEHNFTIQYRNGSDKFYQKKNGDTHFLGEE